LSAEPTIIKAEKFRVGVKIMRESRYDAVIIISCRKKQVLEIIDYVRRRFPDIKVTYEVSQEESNVKNDVE
jgi:hypothetical protein